MAGRRPSPPDPTTWSLGRCEPSGAPPRCDLVKRIPPGAGLGGGSADAAAILRWAGCADLALAAGLGPDVPSACGGRALVRGVGEDRRPPALRGHRFTLFLLPFGVDTGAVYRAWDDCTPEASRTGPRGRRSGASTIWRHAALAGRAASGRVEGPPRPA